MRRRDEPRHLFMMGALVEVDGEEALPQLLEETVAAAERAGRDAVEAGRQELSHTHADVDRDRPATVFAGAYFSGDRDGANFAFDRWNEALAQRATILRTYLRGDDVHREWIDEGFQKELEATWTPEKEEETRQLIESMGAASAERERQPHRWWRDWGQAALYPWRTRALVAVSFAFFGLIFGAPLAPPLLAVLVGALVGLAIAEYGMRAAKPRGAADR